MATTNKTKAELLEEIRKLEGLIIEKDNEIIKYEKVSACANMAEEHKLIYDNYIKAGFSEKQAFDLLERIVDHTTTELMRDINISRNYTRYAGGYIRR